ncbi:unnamed protein product, partial [marine sediment metagenome]
IFACLGGLVDTTYGKTIEFVQKIWSGFEDEEFALQSTIEKSALDLYKQDKAIAKEFLNHYTESQALKSLEVANKMIYKIKWHLWGAGGQNKIRIAIKVDPKIYDAYVGEYDGSPDLRLKIIKKNDRLFCSTEDGPQLEIFPEIHFYARIMMYQIEHAMPIDGLLNCLKTDIKFIFKDIYKLRDYFRFYIRYDVKIMCKPWLPVEDSSYCPSYHIRNIELFYSIYYFYQKIFLYHNQTF